MDRKTRREVRKHGRRTKFVAGVIAAVGLTGAAVMGPVVAGADKPGPGDKQCIPGQNGNPHPGFKAGACSNG
jgi:hypothetical protein